MFNILVVSGSDNLKYLIDYLKDEKDYNAFGSRYDLDRIKRACAANKKLIIVVDYSESIAVFFSELVKSLGNSGPKIIAICQDVKEGFSLLNKGAADMCVRPKIDGTAERRAFMQGLNIKISRVMKDYDKNPRTLKNKSAKPINSLIAIGSSTGGTECILQILKAMPAETPPILIVQHMPPVFTSLYSQRLNASCKISVWEAKDGDHLENGLALIAPGDKQMRLKFNNGRYYVTCTLEDPYGGHIPAVDVLFFSIAALAPKNTTGVILTGMGKDGAAGLMQMRKAGAYTLGQDEASSIVYGMPKVAYDIGAVMKQGSPEFITNTLISRMRY